MVEEGLSYGWGGEGGGEAMSLVLHGTTECIEYGNIIIQILSIVTAVQPLSIIHLAWGEFRIAIINCPLFGGLTQLIQNLMGK